MRYKQALKLSQSDFKRLYGVSHETFQKMKEIVLKAKQGKRGCHSKLSIPDQILLTLQYWREYRTFFHISQDWGIHESTAWRIVKRIEDVLIKAEELHLPSKRQLHQNEEKIEVIVVDVSETEIERPKKSECVIWRFPPDVRRTQDNKKPITVENKSVTLSKCN